MAQSPAAPLAPDAALWVEQTLLSLSVEEKIGQLFMVSAASRPDLYNAAELETAVARFRVGGLIWFQGGPVRQAQLTNRYQQRSGVPLLIGQDAEWGLAMRLDSTLSFPRAMALGALDDDSLLVAFGRQLGRECRAVGVHTPFAPVVDVNNNALNPVIAQRAFGSDKHRVTRCALRVMLGLQSAGALAVAKHFPGHGDTDTDSHYDLPVVRHPRARLDTLELYPFSALVRNGVSGVMVAHLTVPAIDSTDGRRGGRPASLSAAVSTELLRRQLGFEGLVFTDALGMKGVTRQLPPGEVELAAFRAGADVLLMPENLPVAIDRLRRALYAGEITLAELDARVRRILSAKARLGLHRQRLVDVSRVRQVIDSPEAQALYRALNGQAVTLAADPQQRLPLGGGDSLRIALIQLGGAELEPLAEVLTSLTSACLTRLPKDASPAAVQAVLDSLATVWPRPSAVVLALYQTSRIGQPRYGITPTVDDVICGLERLGLPLVCVTLGVPYALQHLPRQAAHVIAWSDDAGAQRAAAGLLLGHSPRGGLPPLSRLSVAVPGVGPGAVRWRSSSPRVELATPATRLSVPRLDSLAQALVAAGAMPGAAVVAVRGREIVFAQGYGRTQAEPTSPPVHPATTLYDLASVTKVAATTLAAMKLTEDGLLDLTAPLSRYLPQLEGRALGRVQVLNLLQHDAGLAPFEHFSDRLTLRGSDGRQPDPAWVRPERSDSFCLPIGPGHWLRRDAPDSAWARLLSIEPAVLPGRRVVYSDLGFILLARVLDGILMARGGQRLEAYLQQSFYQPLGMLRTGPMPALKCWPSAWPLAPTERDSSFRPGPIAGYVHDETAALLGGPSGLAGHAGLFSTGTDLARLLIMLKAGGVYAGRRYLAAETIASFTAARGPLADASAVNRRGLGWDKPPADPAAPSPTSRALSPQAYGHLGFTGTAIWVDPQLDLAVIVLANRTWPTRSNPTYNAEAFRTRAVDFIVEALGAQSPPAGGTH